MTVGVEAKKRAVGWIMSQPLHCPGSGAARKCSDRLAAGVRRVACDFAWNDTCNATQQVKKSVSLSARERVLSKRRIATGCTTVKFQKNRRNRAVVHAGRAQAAIVFIVFSAAGELGFDRAFDQRQRSLLRQGGGPQRTGDHRQPGAQRRV